MIWYTVPGIEYDRQIGNFGSFFVLLPPWKLTKSKFWKKRKKQHLDMSSFYKCVPKKYDHMIYVSWDMECNKKCFLSFWVIFFPFTQLKTQKIKILKIWKKKPGDIILLHICTINEDYMMYGSWDIRHNGLIFFLAWTIVCCFTPSWLAKSKFWKKNEKSIWRYYQFSPVYLKWQSYNILVLRYRAWHTEFSVWHFGPFFALLPH